jgi:hypothetical protein
VIDEALSWQFNRDAVKFVNGMLDAIRKKLER